MTPGIGGHRYFKKSLVGVLKGESVVIKTFANGCCGPGLDSRYLAFSALIAKGCIALILKH